MSNELVSVVIPTFNKGKLIVATMDSVLQQTYKNIELVLVDNGSTDDTRARIKDYLNSRSGNFKVIELKENKGPSNARNVGILGSKGKYIFLLDGDDLLMPEKIDKQVRYMDINPNIGLSLTPYLIYSAKRKISTRLVSELDPNKLVRGWIGMSYFGGLVESTGCIRRSSLDSSLLLDVSLMGSEGLDFTIRWLDRFPAGILHEPLAVYRISSDQLHNDVPAINENITRVTNRYISDEADKLRLLAQQAAFFRLDSIRHRSKLFIVLYLFHSLLSLNLYNIKMVWWVIKRNVKSVILGFSFKRKVNSLLDSVSGGKSLKS